MDHVEHLMDHPMEHVDQLMDHVNHPMDHLEHLVDHLDHPMDHVEHLEGGVKDGPRERKGTSDRRGGAHMGFAESVD